MDHDTNTPKAFMNLLRVFLLENLKEIYLGNLGKPSCKIGKWQVQQLKVFFHLRFLTPIEERILGMHSEHFYQDPFFHESFQKFDNVEHD